MTAATTTPATASTAPLADRARAAAATCRAADSDGFAARHADWAEWARRAATARAIAVALGVPVGHVTVTDDPDRRYGPVPGDLITVTDPATSRAWRFIPDPPPGGGQGWLLLGPCGGCEASVPVATIATLADLGDELGDPLEHIPPECDGDPAHQPGCPHAPLETESKE